MDRRVGIAAVDQGQPVSWLAVAGLALLAIASFHLSFEYEALGSLILVYGWSLVRLSVARSARLAFRFGFVVGMLTFGPQLFWFWEIFGAAAVCLWAVLSLFTGLFVAFIYAWRKRFGVAWLWLAAPVLWTALEYFRSELYFLRFSWLTAGSAFSFEMGWLPFGVLGAYGVGFGIFLVAGLVAGKRGWKTLACATLVTALLSHLPVKENAPSDRVVQLAGIQLEFPPELQLPEHLDRVIARHPDAEIVVLSEYTLDGRPGTRLREWCRSNKRYLVVGGRDDSPGHGNFYNTAFVVDPNGEIVFQQAKSVPIQFFKDGLPARTQQVWNSPWGRIAICVCYDLSYRRVIDRFASQGAQGLIVPFMDLANWGRRQHELHQRVGPLRAREYGIPIFRLGSSGISQNVDARGRVMASAGYPGQEEIFRGEMAVGREARLPLDHWLAPGCVVAAVALLMILAFHRKVPISL